MALSREEELELQKLEEEQSVLTSQLDDIRKQVAPAAVESPIAQPAETGMLEAGARGAAQGLTFGTADEIAAGAEALFTDKPYEQALEESRAEYKAAEQEYPLTTLGGEILGGVGQGIALTAAAGPAGAATAGAGALAKLRRAAQIAKGVILPSKEAGAVKNIAKLAGSGAAIGGATAIGKSEEEGLARLKDAPAGAVSGGVIGGAIGGAAAGIGKAGAAISKAVDEGTMPYSVKMIRDAWRQGLEGQGFISMKDKKKVTDEFFDSADQAVSKIKDTMEELATLKEEIIRNTDKTVTIAPSIQRTRAKLQKLVDEGVADAKPLLNLFLKSTVSIAGDGTKVSIPNAVNLVRRLREGYKLDTSRSVKDAVEEIISDINNNVRFTLTPEDTVAALQKTGKQELLDMYNKYLSPDSPAFIPDQSTANPTISKEDKAFFDSLKRSLARKNKNPEEAAKAEKSLKGTLAALKKPVKGKAPVDPNKLTDKELEAWQEAMNAGIGDSPITKLDSSLHSLLNAQELLGIQGTTKSVPGKSAARMKVFSNLRSQTADTGSGEKAYKLYSEALEEMRKSYAPLAQEVEQITKKPVEKLEVKKFLEGAKLGDSAKETGLIKSVVGAAGQIAATGANVAGQVKGAASRGASGPIPLLPTSLGTRPIVRTLTVAKQSIDDVARANPNSPVWKYMGDQIDQALATKDEVRRAAILNSLMQYESFRKMIGEDWNKKEE
jgi:hypothetical protein